MDWRQATDEVYVVPFSERATSSLTDGDGSDAKLLIIFAVSAPPIVPSLWTNDFRTPAEESSCALWQRSEIREGSRSASAVMTSLRIVSLEELS